jgi:hypothetical protein
MSIPVSYTYMENDLHSTLACLILRFDKVYILRCSQVVKKLLNGDNECEHLKVNEWLCLNLKSLIAIAIMQYGLECVFVFIFILKEKLRYRLEPYLYKKKFCERHIVLK